jgi:hypothetical protein
MVSLLDRRVYGLPDVDRLLVLPPGTARRSIDGYDRGGVHYPPVVRAERTRDEEVTWGEFVDTRLLAEFRARGASMHRLRPAVSGCVRSLAGIRSRTPGRFSTSTVASLFVMSSMRWVSPVRRCSWWSEAGKR